MKNLIKPFLIAFAEVFSVDVIISSAVLFFYTYIKTSVNTSVRFSFLD
ncbi:MAG: hypothetical protein JXR03_13430 [Cyclobacteriaceae bacterium]